MRITFISLLLIAMYPMVFAQTSHWNCGSCGENAGCVPTSAVTATFNPLNASLVIRGAGEMVNYRTSDSVPWREFRGVIRTIVVNEGITSIGTAAFAGCVSLASLDLPVSLVKIGSHAFAGCGMKTVTIPDNVSYVGPGAFADCANVKGIKVSSRNFHYVSEDGVLFNRDKTALIQYPAGKTGDYSIPIWVDSISNYAFSGKVGDMHVAWILPVKLSPLAFARINVSERWLYVPEGTEGSYAKADGWKDFGNIMGPEVRQYIPPAVTKSHSIAVGALRLKSEHYLGKPLIGGQLEYQFRYSRTFGRNELRYQPLLGVGAAFTERQAGFQLRVAPIAGSYLFAVIDKNVHTLKIGAHLTADYSYRLYPQQHEYRLFWASEIGLSPQIEYTCHWGLRQIEAGLRNSILGFTSHTIDNVITSDEQAQKTLSTDDFFVRPHKEMRFGSFGRFCQVTGTFGYTPDMSKGRAFMLEWDLLIMNDVYRLERFSASLVYRKTF